MNVVDGAGGSAAAVNPPPANVQNVQASSVSGVAPTPDRRSHFLSV